MKKLFAGITLSLLCAVIFPSTFLVAQTTAIPTTRISEEGFASWYGSDFHGKKTSSGEIFDSNLLTAAHKTLPFGTVARITDLYSGKTVIVRINDRGPFIEGRSIDLSRAAAEQLGIISAGISKVLIEADVPVTTPIAVLSTTTTTVAPTSTISEETTNTPAVFVAVKPLKENQADAGLNEALHTVQVASFTNSSNADKLVSLLRQRNLPANLEAIADTGKTRVVLRGVTEPKLIAILSELKELGFAQVIVRPQTP